MFDRVRLTFDEILNTTRLLETEIVYNDASHIFVESKPPNITGSSAVRPDVMRTFATTPTLLACLGLAMAQTQITVNVGSTLQEIDGFGVSQAFKRAKEFFETDPTPRQQGLDYLFSRETGAGLTIIRNRIGSTDTDTILPKSPGSPSGTPVYVLPDDDTKQIWFSQEARKYGVTTIYADAWSAPGFMKTNNNEANGGYLCGVTGHSCSSGDWRQAFANMLVQYVKYYFEAGVPVTHLGFLNEPDFV